MSNSELCFLGVTELAALLRARKVSPVEIVDALLARIDAVNPTLRAYIHVCHEQARAAGARPRSSSAPGSIGGHFTASPWRTRTSTTCGGCRRRRPPGSC
jgi:aspartyl-tRNA(Asn)/glutamyl-tRNA(Gln) amidotransferase subunit A